MRGSQERPPCCICGERPIHNMKVMTCHRLECVKALEKQREEVGLDKDVQTTDSTRRISAATYKIRNPDFVMSGARKEVRRLMDEFSLTETDAIIRVAEQFRLKPATVLHACRSGRR